LLGSATRAAGAFLGCDKVYEGAMRLHGDVGRADLEAGMQEFRGPIEQLPPRRSRVKRAPRMRTVYSLEVTGIRGRDVEFRVVCQHGTYIRKLVHDMGQVLGCGAHMTSLRRTRAGPFGLEECATPVQIESAAVAMTRGDESQVRAVVTPIDGAVARVLPAIWVDDGAVHSLTNGAPLCAPGVCALHAFGQGDMVAVMTLKDELVGLARAEVGSAAALSLSRGVVARMHNVLMGRGVYPKSL
jgi:H/ACA ribonucleoprotein complex subunit 4